MLICFQRYGDIYVRDGHICNSPHRRQETGLVIRKESSRKVLGNDSSNLVRNEGIGYRTKQLKRVLTQSNVKTNESTALEALDVLIETESFMKGVKATVMSPRRMVHLQIKEDKRRLYEEIGCKRSFSKSLLAVN